MFNKSQVTAGAVLLIGIVWATSTIAQPLDDRNPSKTGFVATLVLTDQPEVVWSFKSDSTGLSDPAAANGLLFVGDDDGVLHAMTAKHGRRVWQFDGGERIFHPPTSDGDHLCLTNRKGIVALDARSGIVLWQTPIARASRCVIRDGIVFVGGGDGVLRAFDVSTGEQRWKQSFMADAPADPPGFDGARARFADAAARPSGIATDGHAVFQSVFDQCRVVSFSTTGERKSSYQTKGWIFADAAVDEGHLYVGSQDKRVYCFEKASGKAIWSSKTNGRIESCPGLNDLQLFIPSCDGHMYCFDKRTGQRLWKFAVDGVNGGKKSIYSAPIVTTDAVFFAAADGQVYALASATGELLWKLLPSPQSEIYSSLSTDGTRLFVQSRRSDGKGEDAIFALGAPAAP